MRHIIVPLPDFRKEGWLLAACALFALAANVYAIATFKTSWAELITALPWVLALTIVSYGILCICRFLRCGVLHLGKYITHKIIEGRKS